MATPQNSKYWSCDTGYDSIAQRRAGISLITGMSNATERLEKKATSPSSIFFPFALKL